jgi:hypothetical protein
MRPRVLLIAGLLAAALSSMTLAATAAACSCAGPAPGEEREFYRESLKRADGAIVGKLLRKRPVGNEAYPRRAIYVYRVTSAYKAEERLADRRVRVRSAYDGASCGIEQKIGTRGGLFLYRAHGKWISYLCYQVSPADLRRAAKDLGRSRAGTGTPLCASAA